MDALLYALKVAGLTFAAALGILGTIHDYRDKTSGRLTKWGKGAIFGVIISASIAIVAQIIEEGLKQRSTAEAAREAAAAANRSEKVVNELARVLQPLRVGHIFIADLRIPLGDTRFSNLRNQFDKIVDNRKRRYEGRRLNAKSDIKSGISTSTTSCINESATCSPLSVEINAKHSLFPTKGLEASVFRIDHLHLAIYRTPINPLLFETVVIGGPITPDFSLMYGQVAGEPLNLRKDLRSGSYSLMGRLEKDESPQDYSGKIVATPDLAGSQIFVRLPWNSTPDEAVAHHFGFKGVPPITQSQLMPYHKKFEMGAVALHFDQRTMWIPRKAWRKHATETSVYWAQIRLQKNQKSEAALVAA